MRTETIARTIYKFDELSEHAKETARDWWRQCENSDFDTEFMYEDFERVAEALGVTFRRRDVPLYGGGACSKARIFWTGFSSQGDGASFEGAYAYVKQSRKKIREYAPHDSTLHQIADDLFEVQRKHFYRLTATTLQRGRYMHSGCMTVDVYEDGRDADANAADEVKSALRSFADWMYSALEKEYWHRMSAENVDDSIRANEYEFLEDGRIA